MNKIKNNKLSGTDDLKKGFRRPVPVSIVIDQPPEKVWEIISKAGNLELCHPFCSKNPVSSWPGKNSRDEVHYLSGLIFERRFISWEEGTGYDLEIGKKGEETSFVSWRIIPEGSGKCILRITVYPQLLQNIPAFIRWFPFIFYIRPMLKKYLRSVLKGFDWYLTHGTIVPRNQFGSHPWFSSN